MDMQYFVKENNKCQTCCMCFYLWECWCSERWIGRYILLNFSSCSSALLLSCQGQVSGQAQQRKTDEHERTDESDLCIFIHHSRNLQSLCIVKNECWPNDICKIRWTFPIILPAFLISSCFFFPPLAYKCTHKCIRDNVLSSHVVMSE